MDAPERADQLSGLQQKTQRFSHPCRNTIARMPCPSTAVKLSTLCTRPRTSPRSSMSRGAGGGRGDEDVFIAGSSFRSFSRRRSSSSSAVFFARVGASSRRVAADAPAARGVASSSRSIDRSFVRSFVRRRRRARARDAAADDDDARAIETRLGRLRNLFPPARKTRGVEWITRLAPGTASRAVSSRVRVIINLSAADNERRDSVPSL